MSNHLLRFRSMAAACMSGLLLGVPLLGVPSSSSAHHSFAVYDFDTEIPFDGVVETLTFRNPHISMTLRTENDDGQSVIVEFEEGAPANMLVRRGLHPDMIEPGTRITAVGSPKRDDPDVFFLRRVRLEDGREFE